MLHPAMDRRWISLALVAVLGACRTPPNHRRADAAASVVAPPSPSARLAPAASTGAIPSATAAPARSVAQAGSVAAPSPPAPPGPPGDPCRLTRGPIQLT